MNGNKAAPAEGVVRDVLLAVRERLTPPAAWTHGVCARDAAGHPVDPTDPAATCWRADGAIALDAHGDKRLTKLASARLEQAIGYRTTLAYWLNGAGHKATLALLDIGIHGSGGAWDGAQLLELAAELVDEAFLLLDLRYADCHQCGTRHHRNTEHADLGRQLRDLPDKLRRAAKRGTDSVLLGKDKTDAAVDGR
jgi:hypothetical protein